jgi:CRISPR-associated protein Csd1
MPDIQPGVFETDDAAYNSGRLLAVLAEAQAKAHDYKLKGAGVAERYFGTASVSPSSVFPILLRLNRHHLNKIRRSGKQEGFLEDEIQDILVKFRPEGNQQPPNFPRCLDLQQQGRFAIGFYQQKAQTDARKSEAAKNRENKTQEQ